MAAAALLGLAIMKMQAEYSELSGLTVQALVGPDYLPLALDFCAGLDSFLFSEQSLDRFPYQPSYDSHASVETGVRFVHRDFGWEGTVIREYLDLNTGYGPFYHDFGVVETQSKRHPSFQEVAGILSLHRASPLMHKRILRMKVDFQEKNLPTVGLRFVTRKPKILLSLFNHNVVTFKSTDPLQWRFSAATVSLANYLLGGNNIEVLIDPSSLDIVIPIELLCTECSSVVFTLDDDSKRLFVPKDISESLALDLRLLTDGRASSRSRLTAKSLRFPPEYERFNTRYALDGTAMVPLRIRFSAERSTGFITLGQPLLASYKHMYLDNIEGTVNLVPWVLEPSTVGFVPVPVRKTLVVASRGIANPVEFLEDGYSFPPCDTEQCFESGLVPWKIRHSRNESTGLRSASVSFVRRYPKTGFAKSRQVFKYPSRMRIHTSVSLKRGIRLYGSRDISSPGSVLVYFFQDEDSVVVVAREEINDVVVPEEKTVKNDKQEDSRFVAFLSCLGLALFAASCFEQSLM
jgi:hypothetical protein